MSWLAAAAGWWIGGAAGVWLLRRRSRVATFLAVLTTVIGAACLAATSFGALRGSREVWQMAWTLPFGTLALRLDPIAGVFLAPIAVIGAFAAFYAPGYRRLGHDDGPVGLRLAASMVLLASMALVVVAANLVLLLMAWEIMTVASWYLLASHHEEREVRMAGRNYLIAGHVSGAALALLFVFLSQAGSGWMVATQPLAPAPGLPPSGLLIGLALLGFGIKAAIAPLHVWLPDAHASAPSHVSALMSGVLVTLGFYGLLRFVPVLGPLPAGWGLMLMAMGALGACGGIVMALSQRDVKRVLAYSTIENAGLVTLAIGVAVLSTALGRLSIAAVAWTAVLLHVWNHAIAKSLLFLTAGAVARLVASRDLECWGGLLRRLPILGTTLLVGAAAVVGLPGTHGFASEWLLLLGVLRGAQELPGAARLAMLFGIVTVAFAGGAALACFVRLVGIGLLGHPRSQAAAEVGEPSSLSLAFPVVALAGLCVGLVALVRPLVSLLGPAVEQLAPGADATLALRLVAPLPWLAALVPGTALAVLLGRWWLRRTRSVRWSVTWDCGWTRPAPTMQYTASSLAQPITGVLQPALRTSVRWTSPRSLWPRTLAWEARTPERALVELYRPAFLRLARVLGFLGRLQEGQVMVYLRYVGVALLVLLAWLFLPVGPAR